MPNIEFSCTSMRVTKLLIFNFIISDEIYSSCTDKVNNIENIIIFTLKNLDNRKQSSSMILSKTRRRRSGERNYREACEDLRLMAWSLF